MIGKELFKSLKESRGNGFHSFIEEKVFPIAGDIIHENLGIKDYDLIEKLWKKIDIVVNVAATTAFDERLNNSFCLLKLMKGNRLYISRN